MLKKTITYEDFNGDAVSEDHFFHLSKAELVELEMSHDGGLSLSLQRIIDAQDGKGIIAEFKNIIMSSYGRRSPDGRRFVKNQQLREEFESSEAYSTLFMELVTDTDAAIEFINGIVPQGLSEEAVKVTALTQIEERVTVLPAPPKPDPIVVTRAQIAEMSGNEFKQFGLDLVQGKVVLQEDVIAE